MSTHALYFLVEKSGNGNVYIDLVEEEEVDARKQDNISQGYTPINEFPLIDVESDEDSSLEVKTIVGHLIRVNENENELDLDWHKRVTSMVELAFRRGLKIGSQNPNWFAK